MLPPGGRARTGALAVVTVLVLLATVGVAAIGDAEGPAEPAEEAGDPIRGPIALEPEELDADTVARIAFRFELDTIAFDLLERSQVPGMVVVMAIGGEVVAAEAYGTADRASGRALHLDDPLWIGSLTQVLTAVTTLDLVADGRLALEDTVVAWLPELGDALAGPGPPLTVAHLLGHAAGFEDRLLGLVRADLDATPPLEARLAVGVPPRSFAPGARVQYCTVCSALLGVIVERASGEDAEAAVARRVFRPLGLESARLLQRPDPAYDDRTARPHVRGPGGIVPTDVPILLEPTSGAARMSGADVARLLAVLTAAEPGPPFDRGVREAMLAPAFASHPAVSGWTLALAEAPLLGHDALVHGGGTSGAHSMLSVVPRGAVAVFVHVNGQSAPGAAVGTVDGISDVRLALTERLVELVLGDAREPPGPPRPLRAAGADADADADILHPVAGPYRLAGSARTGIEKLLAPSALLQGRVTVGDGRVELRPPAAPSAPRTYVHVGDGVYRRDGGGEALVADLDRRGRALVHTVVGVPVTFELVPVLERRGVVLATLGAFVSVALLVLVSWPVGAYRSWRLKRPKAFDATPEVVRLRWLARAAVAAGLALLGAAAAMVYDAHATLAPPEGWVLVSAWLAAGAAGVLAAWLAVSTVLAVASGRSSRSAGALHALIAAATLALLAQAWVWNLTPWS